jgi:hypothetical protein
VSLVSGNPENGESKFLWNISTYVRNYTSGKPEDGGGKIVRNFGTYQFTPRHIPEDRNVYGICYPPKALYSVW